MSGLAITDAALSHSITCYVMGIQGMHSVISRLDHLINTYDGQQNVELEYTANGRHGSPGTVVASSR